MRNDKVGRYTFMSDYVISIITVAVTTIITVSGGFIVTRHQAKVREKQERELENLKSQLKLDEQFSANAWVDYALRRDIYLQLAEEVDCLYQSSKASSPSATRVPPPIPINDQTPFFDIEGVVAPVMYPPTYAPPSMPYDPRVNFLKLARKVRLVGSDRVVRALNTFVDSISTGTSEEMESAHGALFNAIRRDIRTLRARPAEGTDLDASAFPIQSPKD